MPNPMRIVAPGGRFPTANQAFTTATPYDAFNGRRGFCLGGVADQYNQWLLSQVGVLIDGVMDMNTIRDTDPWYFAVNGAVNYSAQDETHFSPAAQARLAIPLRSQIRALTVNDSGTVVKTVIPSTRIFTAFMNSIINKVMF